MADDAELDAVLDEVLSQPPSDRGTWLDDRCGRDTPIRAQVDRLLRELDTGEIAGTFGDSLRAALERDDGLGLGESVGP